MSTRTRTSYLWRDRYSRDHQAAAQRKSRPLDQSTWYHSSARAGPDCLKPRPADSPRRDYLYRIKRQDQHSVPLILLNIMFP